MRSEKTYALLCLIGVICSLYANWLIISYKNKNPLLFL